MEGSDHTRPLHISVGYLGRRVPSVLLDNGSALNVCPLAATIALGYGPCDAPNPGCPLTTRQPAEYKWMSGYPTPLQKIRQSLLCMGSSTRVNHLHETCPKQSNIITT